MDDGSGPEYGGIFSQASSLPNVHLLRHAVNLGKGAALKTGINFALVAFPSLTGVVTADADGQHHPDDIERVVARLAAKRTAVETLSLKPAPKAEAPAAAVPTEGPNSNGVPTKVPTVGESNLIQ